MFIGLLYFCSRILLNLRIFSLDYHYVLKTLYNKIIKLSSFIGVNLFTIVILYCVF